jgi:internalin A
VIGVTDAELKHLERLTNLHNVYFRNNKVTDVGLEHLERLTNLNTLDLRATKVTDEGVKKLQQALPKCQIMDGDAPQSPSASSRQSP